MPHAVRSCAPPASSCLLLQPLSELTPSDSERLITVSGGRDKVLRAVALILNTVSAGMLLVLVGVCDAGGGSVHEPGGG